MDGWMECWMDGWLMLPSTVTTVLTSILSTLFFAETNLMHLSNDLWTSGVKCLCPFATQFKKKQPYFSFSVLYTSVTELQITSHIVLLLFFLSPPSFFSCAFLAIIISFSPMPICASECVKRNCLNKRKSTAVEQCDGLQNLALTSLVQKNSGLRQFCCLYQKPPSPLQR